MNQRQQRGFPLEARRALVRGCVAVAALLVSLWFSYFVLATKTYVGDDESYVLLTLKHYFAGEQLYTQVFTQYGPFYFPLQKVLFGLLHLPVTFDAGRLVASMYWVLASALGGVFVFRLSKSVTFASVALLTLVWVERVISFEPNHPEELIVVLLMAACCASVNPGPVTLLFMGAIGAALLFTKINIGIFFLAAVLMTAVCVCPVDRLRNNGGKLLVVAIGALPIALMHHFLSTWAKGYCLIGVLAGVSVVLAGMREVVPAPPRMRVLRYIAVGTLAAMILIVLEMMREGLPLRSLLEGVVLGPLRHPEVFSIPFVVSAKMAALAVVLSVSVGVLYWFPERWRAHLKWIDAVKCLAGVVVVALWIRHDIAYSIPPVFTFEFAPAYALLPVILLPRRNARWLFSDYFPRLFVAALAAMQMLQSYPVAGSQVNIGAAPFLLWAFVCIHDGADGRFVLSSVWSWLPGIRVAAVIGVLLAAFVLVRMKRTGMLHGSYRYPASALAGSRSMHLDPEMEETYGLLSNDVRANCQVLFTMPGMASFNFWSGVPTPDGFNMTGWMKGVPVEHQQQTLDELERNPRACVIYRPIMMGVWGVPDAGIDSLPLARYILHEMPTVYTRDGYEIRVSPRRRTPWVEQDRAAAQ